MMYVLLQGPNNGYFAVVKAASDRHFSLEDIGYSELSSGCYIEMLEQKQFLENDPNLINLFCFDTNSVIQTTEDCLIQLLSNEPNFLNNKEFLQ